MNQKKQKTIVRVIDALILVLVFVFAAMAVDQVQELRGKVNDLATEQIKSE